MHGQGAVPDLNNSVQVSALNGCRQSVVGINVGIDRSQGGISRGTQMFGITANIDFAAVAKYLIQFLYTVEDNICVVAI